MIGFIKKFFGKGDEPVITHLPHEENATFELKVDKIKIGILHCENGEWQFQYTDEFKQHKDEYNRITGFPDLDRVYRDVTLWPFFQTRIPGLKQPAVKEILERENINVANEAALLKRFGKKTISNPYELDLV